MNRKITTKSWSIDNIIYCALCIVVADIYTDRKNEFAIYRSIYYVICLCALFVYMDMYKCVYYGTYKEFHIHMLNAENYLP